jgi:hypothetical protein
MAPAKAAGHSELASDPTCSINGKDTVVVVNDNGADSSSVELLQLLVSYVTVTW